MRDDEHQEENDQLDKEIKPLLAETPDHHDEQIQNLTKSLTREQNSRKEERLLWILVTVILLDVTFFTLMESISGPIVIGLLQLIALVIVARRLGLEEVVQIIDKLVSVVANALRRSD